MPTINSVMADVMFLTDYQKEILANRIFEMLSLSPVTIKKIAIKNIFNLQKISTWSTNKLNQVAI